MNCCDHQCDQGRNCPLRAARNSGVCSTEPDPESTSDAFIYWSAIVAFSLVSAATLCGAAGYLWTNFFQGNM